MKKLLNTLFITTHGTKLSKEGETVHIVIGEQKKIRIPIHALNSIVCLGHVSCTPQFMGFCCERGVSICFLSPYGRFLARVQGKTTGNVLLRRRQYRLADDPESFTGIARNIVLAKVANSRTVLRRFLRDYPDNPGFKEIERAGQLLGQIMTYISEEKDLDVLRGREGEAARVYFEVFDHLILQQKVDFFMRGRTRRPPRDNLNALLSFLYTVMANCIVSALESVGLDPAVGFLHRERPGRPSLALDMMEEFRASITDRLVLSLINRRQITGKGFKETETGAVQMSDETRKIVITGYQKRKQDLITHPFTEDTLPIGLVFFVQALLMARFIRGDLDAYPPFFWK